MSNELQDLASSWIGLGSNIVIDYNHNNSSDNVNLSFSSSAELNCIAEIEGISPDGISQVSNNCTDGGIVGITSSGLWQLTISGLGPGTTTLRMSYPILTTVTFDFNVASCPQVYTDLNALVQDLVATSMTEGEVRDYCFSVSELSLMSSSNDAAAILVATDESGTAYSTMGQGSGGVLLPTGNYELRVTAAGPGQTRVVFEGASEGELANELLTVVAALPVELLDLSATSYSKNTLLHWQTASETANRGFHLQHSPNGQSWVTLDFIPGAGDSQTERDYAYTHQNPVPGTNYYRLEQEDYDGTRTLSEVVTAEFGGVGELSITPNPATDLITVTSPLLAESEDFTLTVYDAAGRQLLEQRNALQLQVAELPAGVYTLLLKAGSAVQTERFVRR